MTYHTDGNGCRQLGRAVLERALRDSTRSRWGWRGVTVGDQESARSFLVDNNPAYMFWAEVAELDADELLHGLHRLLAK